jgi:hypothetical protein
LSLGGYTIELHVATGPTPGSSADMWLGFSIGLVVILAAAAWARRRALQTEIRPVRRRTRIIRTAIACALGLTAILAPREYMQGYFVGYWTPLTDFLFALAVTAILYAIAALVLLGALDLFLDLFSPIRSRRWLVIAPPLFLAYVAASAALFAWKGSLPLDPNPRQLLLAAAGLATGLVWWADLPLARRTVARVFE